MEIDIGGRKIGEGHRVFIVAEMSGNHNHSYEKALQIIDAAADAGADAIKLQTYTPDTITIDSDKKYFQVKVNDAWAGQTLYELYKKACTPWDWQPKLKKYAESKGLMFFSTPFDNTAVDFLEKMRVGVYKIASFEIVDYPLLKKIGQTKKPVIVSRGMASVEDIEFAVKTLKDNGCPNVALLHCVSAYPAKAEDMNLATIADMAERFKAVVGLSDHSLGANTSVMAVALGAKIIEKHIILSVEDGGPDAAFSLEPHGFQLTVQAVRAAERALGCSQYGAGLAELENIVFRKSLFVVQDLKKGEVFSEKNMRSIRPGHGLAPKHYDEVMGKRAATDIERGTPISWDLIK
ncbi:MAG: pseudaminic acid synthase [Patescibacteria group bacterium]